MSRHKQDRVSQRNGTAHGQISNELNLPPKHQEALHALKSRVGDIMRPSHDDYYMFRWLKARCFNVEKAEQMYRTLIVHECFYPGCGVGVMESDSSFKSMAYREKMGVDKLLQEYKPPKVLDEYLAGGFCGHDKDGSIVKVELFGYLDMKGLMYSTKKSDLEKTKLHQCETITRDWKLQSDKVVYISTANIEMERQENRDGSRIFVTGGAKYAEEKNVKTRSGVFEASVCYHKSLGHRVTGLTVLFDMDNVGTKSLWRPGLQMYLHLVKVLEDNYPEMMKRLMVINAPAIFPLLWKIGRPMVSDDMKKKIFVLGSDYKETLLKYIDADQIPAYMGGTQTDPDGNPRCVTKICQGGDVPKSYYLSECDETDEMDTTVVARGDKFKMELHVGKPGSVLKWEFRTDDYDLAFGVVHSKNGKEVDVVPVKRLNSHLVVEDDCIVCDDIGLYTVVFDNSYSWSRDKRLHYLVELHTTDNDIDTDVNNLATGGSWTRLYKDMQITHL